MALNFFGKLKTFSKFNCDISRTISFSSAARSKSSNNLVVIDVNNETGYATLSLNNPPVNSLNKDVFLALADAMGQMEKNKTRGVILSSTAPKIFSAGLNINELCDPETRTLRELWYAVQECWLKLHGSSCPVAAALPGHTIAGGCILALSCDYRVMVPKYKFGINEILLGIEVPQLIIDTMDRIVSRRELELALTTGKLYLTEDAHKVGLVDEIAVDKDDALRKCEAFLDRFKNIPFDARSLTKKRLRKDELDYIRQNRQVDIDNFVKSIKNDAAQKAVKAYFNELKNNNDYC